MDTLIKEKVKGLLLKGFSLEEIAKILDINKKEIEVGDFKVEDIADNSLGLYTELQKDLSKLVLTEMNKESRDSNVILNAIKLQAELQDKKLLLTKSGYTSKISKEYIYNRDEEINKLLKEGLSIEEITKKLDIGILSIKQAIDRYNLNLPDELKTLSPSIIAETIGLDKKTRLKILQDAYKNNYTRKQVREIANKIKNEAR